MIQMCWILLIAEAAGVNSKKYVHNLTNKNYLVMVFRVVEI